MINSSLPALGLAGKDLRLRLRGWQWAGIVTLYVGVLALVTLAFLLHRYHLSSDGATQAGVQLFQALAIFQLFLIAFVTPASLAGAVSGERQNRTWEFLLISRLSSPAIVWGKLLSGLAFNLILLAAALPLFALIFLFGGVSLADVARAYLIFVLTVILLGVISLTLSVFTIRVVVSTLLSWFIAFLLLIGLSLLSLYLQSPGQISLIGMLSLPTQTFNQPAPLPVLAQFDPLIALLSLLPADTGGTLLGSLSQIHNAFFLPWALPLWEAYSLWAILLSLVLAALSALFVRQATSRRFGGEHR